LALSHSGRWLTPFGQGGEAVLLEYVAAVEVTVLIEMIIDRGVDGGKFLARFHVPEPCHRPLSSPERLMCVLSYDCCANGRIPETLHYRSYSSQRGMIEDGQSRLPSVGHGASSRVL
jgi:hypothetical protein